MHLIIATSLNPNSRSALLAEHLVGVFESRRLAYTAIDLRELPLPACDGERCYENANVRHLSDVIGAARTVTMAAPVYNYDLPAARHVAALAGSALNDKIIGLMAAGGGRLAYMAPMGLAGSLMLDFRCLVIPRFVYASSDDFAADDRVEADIAGRIDELADRLDRLARAMHPEPASALRA